MRINATFKPMETDPEDAVPILESVIREHFVAGSSGPRGLRGRIGPRNVEILEIYGFGAYEIYDINGHFHNRLYYFDVGFVADGKEYRGEFYINDLGIDGQEAKYIKWQLPGQSDYEVLYLVRGFRHSGTIINSVPMGIVLSFGNSNTHIEMNGNLVVGNADVWVLPVNGVVIAAGIGTDEIIEIDTSIVSYDFGSIYNFVASAIEGGEISDYSGEISDEKIDIVVSDPAEGVARVIADWEGVCIYANDEMLFCISRD